MRKFRTNASQDLGRDPGVVDQNMKLIEGFQNELAIRFDATRKAGQALEKADVANFVACEQVMVLHSIASSLYAIRTSQEDG